MDAKIPDSLTKGNPEDMVVIYGFPTVGNTVTSSSPFVGKVETYCRMLGIPYEVQFAKGVATSPKSTLPYIQHGNVKLADSTFIVDYLAATYPDKTPKQPRDDRAKGMAIAAQRLCENHLYYGALLFRWLHPKGWNIVKTAFFPGLPTVLFWFVPGQVRQQIQQQVYKQGFGRHSEGDVCKLLDKSLRGLSQIIGNNKYLTGKEVCEEDATVFATLDNYLNQDMGLPMEDLAKQYPNLVSYVENMKSVYYSEEPSKFKKD